MRIARGAARRLGPAAVVATCLLVACGGVGRESATAEPVAAPRAPPAPAVASTELPPPRPAAPTQPLVIAGHVTRPDGTGLRGVEVTFWRRDAGGELAEVVATIGTQRDGAFELPPGDWLPQVAAVRCRWTRHRARGQSHVVAGVPLGDPVDAWLEAPAIADWSSIAVVLDTGWTVSGLVHSLDPRFDLRGIQVKVDLTGQSQAPEETGVFVIRDLPWDAERCAVEVFDRGLPVASGEALRPDREHGAREAWVELLVPVR